MPREYETIFIIRPDIGESETTQVLERMRNTLANRDAVMFREQYWGKKKMAYEVKRHMKGHYYYFHFAGEPGTVEELERNLKLVEPVIKFQTVKLADKIDIATRVEEIQKEEQEASRRKEEADRPARDDDDDESKVSANDDDDDDDSDDASEETKEENND